MCFYSTQGRKTFVWNLETGPWPVVSEDTSMASQLMKNSNNL